MKRFWHKTTAMMLAAITILSMALPAQAASISDGKSSTVTVRMGTRNTFLKSTVGNTIGGEDWTYTTNDGISGPAFCIDHGLKSVPPTKALAISGRYLASPKTMGAFANGYPQFSLADFLAYNSSVPELSGLTETEYAYATQLAVWATLGQLAVEGTAFTAGRATIAKPTGDAQKGRVFKALEIILINANSWSKVLYTGMYLRIEDDKPGAIVDLGSENTLDRAATLQTFGIRKEIINGKEYYTRSYFGCSATSTFFNDHYCIDVWAENAPTGTIFVNMQNQPLETKSVGGSTHWKLPTTYKQTNLNANGVEWSGEFKLCVPVDNVTDKGDIAVKIGATVRQYDIYLATNPDHSEQSYIIADPATTDLTASGALKWNGELGEGDSTVVVTKVDGVGNVLQGAKFTLEGPGVSLTGTSDLNGQITWAGVAPGSYTLRETQAPAGFTPVAPTTIVAEADKTSYITVRNNTESMLTIKKLDAQNGYPLLGATFKFRQIDGSFQTTAVTGHDGMITFDSNQLPFGNYEVTEIQAPAGYELDTRKQTVNWNGTADMTLTFQNVRKMGFTIIKVDAMTGVSLLGAKFNIYKDGNLITSAETDWDGFARVSGLSEGYYEVTETVAPQGYVLDTARHGIHIDPYNPATTADPVLVVTNKAQGSLRILKYDAQTMKPLADCVFEVYHDTSLIGSYTTNADGTILLSGLAPGTYLVKEVAAPGSHVVNSVPQQIEIKAGDTATTELIFLNQLKPGIKLIKLDSATIKPLSGATYLISKVGGSFSQEYTTDATGEITLTGLEPGAYTVKEVKAPVGYLIDDGVRTIQISPDENAVFVFTDTKMPNLTVRKVDSVTGDPIKGAKFQIWRSVNGSLAGELVDLGTFYSDAKGEIKLQNQEMGWYRVTELEPPAGYTLKAPSTQDVFLEAGKDKIVTFENIPKSALIIRKIDNNTSLPVTGAAFRVRYLGGTSGTGGTIIYDGVTSTNGTIVITGLKGGTYIAEEYRPASGYELANPSTQTAYLSGLDQDVITLTFTNAHKGGLIIKKLDAVSKQPIAGVAFKVTDSSGAVIGPNNGEYITDAGGLINLQEHLTIGSTIVVQEVKCPDGYILDTTAQTIKIAENTTHSLTFYNTPKSGLQIVKIDSVTKQPIKGAQFTVYKKSGEVLGEYVSDKDGLIILDKLSPGWVKIVETKAPSGYILDETPKDVEITSNQFIKVVFENKALPGLQILKIDEETRRPIAGVEFAVARMNGERIGTYRTDSEGLIRLPELTSGWYEVTEVKQAKGYLLDTKAHNIELKDGKTAVLTITNKKASGIIIHKIDSITGKGIYGVTFLLSDEGNNPVGQFESDQDGFVYIGGELPEGRYKIRELKPASGYAADDTVRTIYLEYGRTSEIEWKNTPVKGQIIVTKRSAQYNEVTRLPAGSPLSGAVFEVYSTAGNLVDRMVSDAKGIAASKPIPLGVYFVKEVSPPKYYALNPREFFAELKHNGDIVRFECLDENTTLGVTIQKKSQNQATPGQTIYYDLFNIANTSSVPLQNFYVHDRLPTDAVRGNKLFTGTWSDRLTYRVTYKTNYSSDYRVLASGLSTKTNSELSIHPNVLGLANGEYVTDIRFEFGTVPAGFKSVENPKLMVQVLPTLPKDYKIVNRADVGGLYINEWETAQCSWTTLVIGGYNPPVLPKTGF